MRKLATWATGIATLASIALSTNYFTETISSLIKRDETTRKYNQTTNTYLPSPPRETLLSNLLSKRRDYEKQASITFIPAATFGGISSLCLYFLKKEEESKKIERPLQ